MTAECQNNVTDWDITSLVSQLGCTIKSTRMRTVTNRYPTWDDLRRSQDHMTRLLNYAEVLRLNPKRRIKVPWLIYWLSLLGSNCNLHWHPSNGSFLIWRPCHTTFSLHSHYVLPNGFRTGWLPEDFEQVQSSGHPSPFRKFVACPGSS